MSYDYKTSTLAERIAHSDKVYAAITQGVEWPAPLHETAEYKAAVEEAQWVCGYGPPRYKATQVLLDLIKERGL